MPKSSQTVLIVDDQDNWRGLLLDLLNDEFDVTAVATYEQAVREVQSKTPAYHVVITDIRLIDVDQGDEHGLRLVEQLKREGTKAIVITGYPTVASIHRAAFGLHVHHYLEKFPSNNKPFNSDEFLEIVRKAANEAEMSRSNFAFVLTSNLAFVLMPFADDFLMFYENEIKRTIESLGFVCKRADDFYASRRIIGDIQACIAESKVIVADLTGCNPNVVFEVGIAHALAKNVLLLTQDFSDIPKHLRTVRFIRYEKTWTGAANFVQKIRKAILETQVKNDDSLFDRNEVALDTQRCFALIPDTPAGRQTYDELILRTVDNKHITQASIDVFNSTSTRNDIWAGLGRAGFVIADLTGRDPDVFYLTGLAFGLRKKIIYIARSQDDVPFDLQEGSCLYYSLETYEAGLHAKQRLAQFIDELMC